MESQEQREKADIRNHIQHNPKTNNYVVTINEIKYNIDSVPALSVDNYKFNSDTLIIEIVEFYDNLPISKLSQSFIINK